MQYLENPATDCVHKHPLDHKSDVYAGLSLNMRNTHGARNVEANDQLTLLPEQVQSRVRAAFTFPGFMA